MLDFKYYEKLLDSLDVPCGLLKFEQTKLSKFLYINKKACDITGFTADEILINSPYDFLEGIDQSNSQDFKRVFVENGKISLGLFLKTKDKCRIPIEANFTLLNILGELYISFTLIDVSANYKIVKQMSYKDHLLQNVWNNSLNGIAVSDENGIVVDANSKYLEIYEYTQDEILNKPFYIIFDKDKQEDAIKQYKNIFNSGEKIPYFETEIVTKSGIKKFIRAKYDFIYDENENKLMISSVEDISEEKEKANQLIQSEKKFRELFTSINNSVFIHRHNNKHKSQFIDVNERAIEKYGYTREEFLQISPFDITIVNDEDIEKIAAINKELDTIGHTTFEVYHKDKFGVTFPVEVSSSKVILDGEEVILSIARDISNRIEAQEKINSLNQRITSSMLAGNMAWWEMELPSGRIEFNENKTIMLGYNKDDFNHYYDFMNIVHPEDYDNLMNAMKFHLDGKLPLYEFQYRIKDAFGKYHWFHDIGKITERKGEYIKISGIITNITDKKEVQELLANERKQFLSLLESIPENIYVADFDTYKILYANKSFRKSVNLKDNSDKKCYELIHGLSEPCSFCKNKEILATNEPIYSEIQYSINGNHYYQILRSIRWDDGRKVRFELAIDITKIKEFETQLKENELKLKTILETIPELIFHYDNNGKYINYYQENQSNKLFIKPEEFLGRTVNDVFGEEFGEKVIKKIREALNFNTSELEYSLEMGETKHFRAIFSKLNESEVICVVQDVTTYQTTQKELRELNATKDKFFSIISHDLRGPFTGFLGLTDIMHKEFDNLPFTDMKKIAKSIFDSATALYNLLNELLLWSTSQLGTLPFNPLPHNVNDFIVNTVKLLNESALAKKISLITDLAENPIIVGDSNMITTVVRNLINNAIKYTNENGTIIIKSDILDDEKSVLISVEDNGIGMSESILSQLFTLENKYSAKGTKGERGTGLGLILCKEFVDKHNGKIWAESKIGQGSKFSIMLPFHSLFKDN